MSQTRYYCLGCNRPLTSKNCVKCKTTDLMFGYSSKLRVPPITNKAVFRQFLDDCPIFVNMVPENLIPEFLQLLRKVKYFGKTINGHTWTNIKR